MPHRVHSPTRLTTALLTVLGAFLAPAGRKSTVAAEPAIASFDFRDPQVVAAWQVVKHVASKQAAPDGMRLELAGDDPHLEGPARDYPPGVALFLLLRLRAERAGAGQVYFFDVHATEANSVRFLARPGKTREIVVPLPPLGKNYRLRLDPPGTLGHVVVERIDIVPRPLIEPHAWPTPTRPAIDSPPAATLVGGQASIRFGKTWGAMDFRIGATVVAGGHNRQEIGYWHAGQSHWIPLADVPMQIERADGDRVVARAQFIDAHGGRWTFEQKFAAESAGGFAVESSIGVDSVRELVHAPLFSLLTGLGGFGSRKTQALLAGLEYLDDEPSSSTADIEGPGANRRVPDATKHTLPLMAVGHLGKYVALAWEPNPEIAAVFDSPDRIGKAPAHLFGLIAPGSDGDYRRDGELLPFRPLRLESNTPLRAKAVLFLGDAEPGEPVMVAAVRRYVARHGLPPLPPAPKLNDYVRQTAAGWLDSGLREGDRYRHAVGPGFGPMAAADTGWMMRWLAAVADDPVLARRLSEASIAALAQVTPGTEYGANVGHLRHPVAGFVFDRLASTVEQARQSARGLLGAFDPDGVARYRPPTHGLNFARTHFSTEASGHGALAVAQLLKAALYAGDKPAIDEALDRLDRLSRFDGAVPRGAQTWEVPLHTPDIMAAAHMAEAYALGYLRTGNEAHRRRAIHWAWTGVPFVYLRDPADGPIGRYATIPVLGATHWKAPNWIGLPVQWCGLVYADALRRVERLDPSGPWKQLADGIVLSAIAQTYPLDHSRRGLLPDSFSLQTQQRNPADINPGTLQPLALALLTGVPACDDLPAEGIVAPGRLERLSRGDEPLRIRFTGWNAGSRRILLHSTPGRPIATVDGKPLAGVVLQPLPGASQSQVLELPPTRRPVEISFAK